MNRPRRTQLRNLIGEFSTVVEGTALAADGQLADTPLLLMQEPIARSSEPVVSVRLTEGQEVGRLPRDVAHWLASLLRSGVIAVEAVAANQATAAEDRRLPMLIAIYPLAASIKSFRPQAVRVGRNWCIRSSNNSTAKRSAKPTPRPLPRWPPPSSRWLGKT